MDVVEVREIDAPKNTEPLHWTLLTDRRLDKFEDAWTVIGYYEKRPLIEEYHKAAKTGCQIEERLYRTAKRLERVVGILSILAMRLVQMKSAARAEPERPALEVAPEDWSKHSVMKRRVLNPSKPRSGTQRRSTLATSFAELPHWEASLAANQMVNQVG